MTSRPHQPSLVILTLLILAILACQVPQTAISTPTGIPVTPLASPINSSSTTPPHPVTSVSPTKRPDNPVASAIHRIATHRIYGIAEFFDRQTSRSFTPRGVNYSIIIPILDHYEDRLFSVGVYDHKRTQADFSAITAAGYNTVRIILDGCTSGDACIGIQNGQGLNPVYLDNIADLMNLAKEANLFLLMASSELPSLGGYADFANQGASESIAAGVNSFYLTSSGIQAAQQYWSDLLSGLISRQAPFDIVLGWELQADQYYQYDQAPFILEKSKVKPANGKTYTLTNLKSKTTLAEDGLRYYIDQVRQTILKYDPTALVSMGFSSLNSSDPWNEGDDRLFIPVAMLKVSSLDFFDFHTSPGTGISISEISQNFGLGGHVTKPVLMGEVGAYTWTYPQVSDGVIAVQDWIADSCLNNFSGWIYKGYYPEPAGLPDATWGFVDEQNTILQALSPKNQPDACNTTVLPGRNLAQGKQVSVSAALPDQSPDMAVDGDPNTQWSAGGFPIQWIEIDLGASYSIGEIRLTVGMWPAGEVIHQVWVGSSLAAMRQVYEISGQEYDFDVLSYMPGTGLDDIRYVRIVTTESPSWVSWREIEVLAPFPKTPTPAIEITPTP